jgi:hypothetical protein
VDEKPTIVLDLPDRTQLRMNEAEARSLADRLWEMARQRGGTAMLAVAIDAELQRGELSRRPIDVPESAAARLREALRPDEP